MSNSDSQVSGGQKGKYTNESPSVVVALKGKVVPAHAFSLYMHTEQLRKHQKRANAFGVHVVSFAGGRTAHSHVPELFQ
jgi:hypothetical protein